MKSYFDTVNDVEYVNLQPYLAKSFQEYQYYITDNDLVKLSSKEKKQLGIHFILKQIFSICQESKNKKCFYYQWSDKHEAEKQLVKRIFNVLPSRIIFEQMSFEDFVEDEAPFYPYTPVDTSKVSWKRFKMFLKRQNLTMMERNFVENINVKLSLIH